MKRVGVFNAGLLGLSLVGLISIINPTIGVSAEEKVVAHEGVIQPTRALMNDIAKRMNNILDGILAVKGTVDLENTSFIQLTSVGPDTSLPATFLLPAACENLAPSLHL